MVILERIAIWAVIALISLCVEGATTALVSIWFVAGSAACVVLELAGMQNFYIQCAVFILVSALLVLLLRKKIRKSFETGKTKTNTDLLIGKTAVVEVEIPEGDIGRVRVPGGMSWAAYTDEKRAVCVGEKVKILDISGVKLQCVPFEDAE
jgi:membrane protein implicated in regulation of membrane protease activity